MSERWMTQEQAEELLSKVSAEIEAMYEAEFPSYEDVVLTIERYLAEATVRPGDAGWCWPTKGRCIPSRNMCLHWTVKTNGRAGCGHPDYREGHCPKEAT